MIKVIVAGAKGRMGSKIATLVKNSKDMELVAGIDKGDLLENEIDRADVVIDFTVALAAAANVIIAAKHKKAVVIGTTGLSDFQMGAVKEAAGTVPVVMSPNMSVGVNVMFKLIDVASRALGKNFDIDIEETHHIHKLDRPSGTAKKILSIVLEKTGKNQSEVKVESIRTGEVVGDHVIRFANSGETLSIEHHANSRDVFADGAIVAARWVAGKPAGLYGMNNVLGL